MQLTEHEIATLGTKRIKEIADYDGPQFDRSGHQLTMTEYREQREAAERRSRPRPTRSPLISNTGGKVTDDTTKHEVCIDWLRLSGPSVSRSSAVEVLTAYFGNPVHGKGGMFLPAGYHFGSARVYYDGNEDGKDHCVVEIPASTLSEITYDHVLSMLRDLLRCGFRMCRFDIAVDLYDTPELIQQITDSCINGELCRAKKFEPKHIQSGSKHVGHGCNIGDRGSKGSGRYLRVYDKGLEQKDRDKGRWVRWEAELAHDCAQEAVLQILEAEDPIKDCLAFAFGVCDFRQNTGAAHLSRRPRVKWYEELLRTLTPQRVVSTRAKSTLHSFKRWMQTSVLPRLEVLSAATGNTLDQLIPTLFGQTETDPELLEDPKVRAMCHELDVEPSAAMYRLGNRRLVMVTAGGWDD